MAYKCLGPNLALGIYSSFWQRFFKVKFNNNFEKRRTNTHTKNGYALITEKIFKYTKQLPKVHSNCSCTPFLSSFWAQLIERFCCLYRPPHFIIKQLPQYCSNATALQQGISKYLNAHLDPFGPIWNIWIYFTYLDLFGPIWTYLDLFGHI